MSRYYVVKNRSRDWAVRFTRFGCASDVVETFTTAAAARAYARKLNQTLGG